MSKKHIKPLQRLTPKAKRFVKELMVDDNGIQAVVRSGYSKRSAKDTYKRLMASPCVVEAIAKAREKRSAKLERKADDVLRDILETAQEAREAGKYQAALKGFELEGRHLGMFADRLKIEHSFEGVSDDALKHRLAELLAPAGGEE